MIDLPGSVPAALPGSGPVLLVPPGTKLDADAVERAAAALLGAPAPAAVLDLPAPGLPSALLALLLEPARVGAVLVRAELLGACGGLPERSDPLGCARAALRLATAFDLAPSASPLAGPPAPGRPIPPAALGAFAREALSSFALEDLYPALRSAGGSRAEAASDLATRLYAAGRSSEAIAVAHHAQVEAEGRDPGTDLRWSRGAGALPPRRPAGIAPPPAEPRVSFVVATLDRPLLLARSLQSIAEQSVRDCEAIVVNDGGADPLGALEPFRRTLGGGGRVTLVHHDRNRGLAAARNTGLRMARGRYVAFLDDDDRLLPHHLAALLPRLALGARIVHADVRSVHETPSGACCYGERSDVHYQFDYDALGLQLDNRFPVHSLLCERSLVLEAGGFDESLPALEDWDLWLRVFRLAAPEHVRRVTTEVRRRAGSAQMSDVQRPSWLEIMAHIYEKTLAYERAEPRLRALRVQTLLAKARQLGVPFPSAAQGWLRGDSALPAIDPRDPDAFLRLYRP